MPSKDGTEKIKKEHSNTISAVSAEIISKESKSKAFSNDPDNQTEPDSLKFRQTTHRDSRHISSSFGQI